MGVSPDSYVWYFALARPRLRSRMAIQEVCGRQACQYEGASAEEEDTSEEISSRIHAYLPAPTCATVRHTLGRLDRVLQSSSIDPGDARQLWMKVEVLYAEMTVPKVAFP